MRPKVEDQHATVGTSPRQVPDTSVIIKSYSVDIRRQAVTI